MGTPLVSLAITPNGKRAVLTTRRTEALITITLATRKLGRPRPIHTGRGLNDSALTPDGKRAYAVP